MPRWLGVGISPSVSVQQTLDGDILSEEEFNEAIDEMSRAPCDRKCLLALEDVCKCRCGGINHGKWVRGAVHNTSLDVFSSEGAPIVSRDIMRGKFELMLLAKQELVAAYGSLLGGLRG
jgi:hypothetical protein